jgi:hypothetical protein
MKEKKKQQDKAKAERERADLLKAEMNRRKAE